ncbi:ubiquitin carboxyl-terminal hydrolase 23 [Pyrus x bretschneideri]|uniref:ubiquitin carboxyl-terminal hydrolase 23 n=1 Tax=Pyrus x bretschneideri TaxID=225117 RepID=UPI000511B590|nr:ubiquitin carboxyl-terminal hydrolase 23 [Pyrus x bretschneideri]
MADVMVQTAELQRQSDGFADLMPESETGSNPLQRRIEFHRARKPFNGLNTGGGDFRLETLNPGNSGGSSSNQAQSGLSAKKRDGSEFLENGFDPELSFGITFRRIGAGLRNMGNTCYLNSVLQCLTYTEPLAAYLQSGKHRNSCHIAGFCALCAIQKHVSLALQSTGRILVPKDLVINLRCISRTFTKSRQEDAHEYMVNLLESMHKCCLPSGVPSESPSAYEKSLVHKIFGGRLRSQVKCMQCSYCSNKFDPFLDLSLEIFNADSLQKALGNFTAAEQLDGGERQYQCQRCNQKVRALKQMTVQKPPYVLTIHLKRFRAHDPGRKIDRHVKFGPTLDLKPFVSGSYEGELKYTLYGVLVHCGATTYSGHYYCYVRTSSGMWYSLDDNQVYQVSERTVLEQKAYMLFYVRDRRNIIPRKPVEVARKENFNANGAGLKTPSTNNQGSKVPIQNGSVEGRSSGPSSSIVVTQKSIIVPPMVPLLKDASVNCQAMTENMVPMKEPVSESSPSLSPFPSSNGGASDSKNAAENTVPMKEPVSESSSSLPKDSLKGISIPIRTSGKDMLPSSPTSNGGTSGPENATAAKADANKTDLNERGRSIENGISSVISPNVKDPESLEATKPIQDETPYNNNVVSSKGDLSMSSGVPRGTKREGIHTVKSSDEPSSKISQVGSFTNGSAACNVLGEKTSDSGQKMVIDESANLPGSLIVANGSLLVKSPDCKRHRKLKKKQLKSKVACMQLRPSLLSRVVLSVQKKKKHKRSKHPSSDTKSLLKEHVMDNSCLYGMGPSTSEQTRSIPLVNPSKRNSKRKGTKSGLKNDADGTDKKWEVKSHHDSLTAVQKGVFGESLGQNGTVLASDKRLQNGNVSSSCSKESLQEMGGNDTPHNHKRDRSQIGGIGVLTRGLDETVVARWDEIELPPSHIIESSRAESVSIGYIPDEWDEEYDRGKRKKVKQPKETFGGPNPFQRIATQRSKVKKAKLDRYGSGNHPLRI